MSTLTLESEEMIIGFTGTRHGMSLAQRERIDALLRREKITEVHHGDCVGSDATFHALAMAVAGIKIVVHPPEVHTFRAWKTGWENRQPKPYHARNHDIVNESRMLVATPAEMTEQLRSGTWMTVRYARKQGKPVLVVLPDGTLTQ